MKLIFLALSLFLFLAFASSSLAQSGFKITKNISCELQDGELKVKRRQRFLKERAVNRLLNRLERKFDRVRSKRKQDKLEERIILIESCLDGDSVDDGEDLGDSPGNGDANSFTCGRGASKQVNVFSVTICATARTDSSNLLHTARIMAEYLDNDEDGVADDPLLISTLKANGAILEMYKDGLESETNPIRIPDEAISQPHFSNETFPNQMQDGVFDITLEETLHLISSAGLHYAYPDDLGEDPGSRMTNAMDIARGGYFSKVPASYPDDAWYSYDDKTCQYICMASEYFYWALTSLLGGQDIPGRLDEIGHEWRPNTPEKLRNTDPAMYEILTDPRLKLPTRLPDGNYAGGTFTILTR